MSATMSAIDIAPSPPWPIASCGGTTGGRRVRPERGHGRVGARAVVGDGCRLGHRVADVVRHRLPGAVKAAVPHPAAQLRQVGPGWVVDHGRGLADGVRVHAQDAGTAAEDRLGDVLAGGPLDAGDLQDRGGRAVTVPGCGCWWFSCWLIVTPRVREAGGLDGSCVDAVAPSTVGDLRW